MMLFKSPLTSALGATSHRKQRAYSVVDRSPALTNSHALLGPQRRCLEAPQECTVTRVAESLFARVRTESKIVVMRRNVVESWERPGSSRTYSITRTAIPPPPWRRSIAAENNQLG